MLVQQVVWIKQVKKRALSTRYDDKKDLRLAHEELKRNVRAQLSVRKRKDAQDCSSSSRRPEGIDDISASPSFSSSPQDIVPSSSASNGLSCVRHAVRWVPDCHQAGSETFSTQSQGLTFSSNRQRCRYLVSCD